MDSERAGITSVERQADRIRQIRGLYVSRLAHALRLFFREQAERVVLRWLTLMGAKAAERTDPLMPLEEEALLAQVVVRVLGPATDEIGAFTADLGGADPFTSGSRRLQEIIAEGGDRITGITEETRRAIMRTISDGIRAGYTAAEIANGVQADGFRGLRAVVAEVYQGRAETIARTEVGMATNGAALDRSAAAGLTHVQLMDGPGCHLFNHTQGPIANGLVLPIRLVWRYRLSHPNCRRVILPYRKGWPSTPNVVPIPAIAGVR